MVDEKYYLSEKMTRYVLDADKVSQSGGWCKGSVVNPSVAHAITVRGVGGVQRAGVENYVVHGLPQDFPTSKLLEMLVTGKRNQEQFTE